MSANNTVIGVHNHKIGKYNHKIGVNNTVIGVYNHKIGVNNTVIGVHNHKIGKDNTICKFVWCYIVEKLLKYKRNNKIVSQIYNQ